MGSSVFLSIAAGILVSIAFFSFTAIIAMSGESFDFYTVIRGYLWSAVLIFLTPILGFFYIKQ